MFSCVFPCFLDKFLIKYTNNKSVIFFTREDRLKMDSATNIWTKVLDLMRKDFTEVAIETWFKECRAVKYEDGRLFVHTPVVYNKEIIKERFLGAIRGALSELFSSDDVDIVILDDADLAAMSEAPKQQDFFGINEYTFSHFVVGSSNQMAHAASYAVANGNRKDYNPLFIWGDSGLGKTHLLYAIRYAVEKKFPHYKVVYVKGEDFTNDLIDAIKRGRNVEFREKYRGTDFFLMDDIQFIAGKEGTQEEYFNTFNTLYELGKQIVLTSDRPPKDMYLLEDRLRTRFEQGLIVDIKPPDDALRVAIIRSKAEQLGVPLSDEVTQYIAENLNKSVRQLEGAVKMVMAYRDLVGEEISVENIKIRLKDAFIKGGDFIPSADDIINETAKFYMQTPDDLKGKSRATETKNARHVAMYLIRYMTNLSLMEIGKIFDNMHHSSVLSAVKKLEEKKQHDSDLSNKIRDITANIQSRSSSR